MSRQVPDPVYERGTQAILIDATTTTVTQTGTAAPTATKANTYAIDASLERSVRKFNAMVQIDVPSGAGTLSALTVNLLGSLDGVNFYVIASFTGDAGGGMEAVSGAVGVRFIAASITVLTSSGGTPTVTVSFSM